MSQHDSYQKALQEVAGSIQVVIYKRQDAPLRDRAEAIRELKNVLQRVVVMGPNGKRAWRVGLLELAAMAIFAAVSDE